MKTKKARTAAIVIVIAMAIALSGTFAWQSISQMARNDAKKATNPGGRLHDDFSGYGADDTKDIYVENFGNQPIYARVRLDEYMEIGQGAGLKGTADAGGAITPNPKNKAVSLVTGAKLDDMTTWTTHIPGDTGADTGKGTEAPTWANAEETFHTYWTWTMGGQDTEHNPDGKTVYMPTFNKNKDSLKADVNGTLAGKDKDPTKGEQYDDYVKYTGTETADRVRDEDTEHYPDGATYDIDADTDDECGPYGGAGGTGVDGVNYGMAAETHKAQDTMTASVITMAEYKTKTDAQKTEFQGWVYDADGWAYWSQPIPPGEVTDDNPFITNATGLLLDKLYMEKKPGEAWYYGINAVGQFITAEDLGRSDSPQTGFYAAGKEPSEDALALLDFIGVNISSVKGAIKPSASVTTVEGTSRFLSYAVQGMDIALTPAVTVADVARPSTDVTWTVTGNTDETTAIRTATRSAGATLHVGASETGTLTLTARSNAYPGLKGVLTLPVRELAYTVTVTPDDTAAILPGGTRGFTAKLTSNNPSLTLPQTFTWTLDGTYKNGTSITPADDTSKATLTVAKPENAGSITVKATPQESTYAGVTGTADISVTPVTYTVDILDSAETPASVKDTTVTIKDGESATFTPTATSEPTVPITDNWTWSSDGTDKGITVGPSNGTVSVARNTATGTTATITATNSDYTPALTASFTVNVQKVIYTVKVNPTSAAVYPTKTQAFTATVEADDGTTPDPAVTWSVTNKSDSNTKFEGNTLTVGANETWGNTLTVTATHTATGNTGTATVTVATPTFTVEIQDSLSNKVTSAEIAATKTATFKVVATPSAPTPSDVPIGGTWTWTSGDTSKATVAPNVGDTTQATVTIPSGATPGTTATITATNSKNSTLTTSISVKVKDPLEDVTVGEKVTINGKKFIVLLNNVTVKGKAEGESTVSNHKAALLLAETIEVNMAFDSSTNNWKNSTMRTYLNNTRSGWLQDKPTVQSKALEVKLKTRQQFDSNIMDETDDKVFLLSSADVCDQYFNDGCVSSAREEYTYNNQRIPYFATGALTEDEKRIGKNSDGTATWWWLRSPCANNKNITLVTEVGVVSGDSFRGSYGVRPAFWYKLS